MSWRDVERRRAEHDLADAHRREPWQLSPGQFAIAVVIVLLMLAAMVALWLYMMDRASRL